MCRVLLLPTPLPGPKSPPPPPPAAPRIPHGDRRSRRRCRATWQREGWLGIRGRPPRRASPPPRHLSSIPGRGRRSPPCPGAHGPAPVRCDGFLPHRLRPSGPRPIRWSPLPKSLSTLFSSPSSAPAQCFNRDYQTIF